MNSSISSPISATDNRAKLLSTARVLAQTRGFNAFSYRDLAEIVGIKTASIHYHFPNKDDLGVALIHQYTESMMVALHDIDSQPIGYLAQFNQFVQIFEQTSESSEQWCLAGMFASDVQTLSEAMRQAVTAFFIQVEQWLNALLERAVAANAFRPLVPISQLAPMILASLEGALLTTRLMNQPMRLQGTAQSLTKLLGIR
ncbi:TetR family transcriptional regulator [Formosimonas limnophila]|uniref:TetR family transcriptional regulator n=1 Tax=Formosimonas limnophila TaxID=1384487 RepID=A0A8J3CM27_9BURK|nr:TetR/AcrR family transcriptional regulator [Formosimonas limnophila]GHA68149.1 TetR family transcriptional regulator [Formosimonas limnophila]